MESFSASAGTTTWQQMLGVLVAFIGGLLFLNFISIPLLDAGNRGPSETLVTCYIGFLIGQCIFLVVLGGLFGTSWIDGYLLGCVLATVGLLLTFMGATLAHDSPPSEVWASFLLVPGAVFAAYCPILLMRHFANWRLVVPGKRYPKLSNDLGGIFVNIALIASVLVILRGPQVIWRFEPGTYWLNTLGVGGLGILIAAVVTVPLARIVVNCDDPIQLLIRLGVLAMGGAGAFLGAMLVIAALIVRQPLPGEFFIYLPIGTIAALVVVYAGVLAIRLSGLRFQTAGSIAPLNDAETDASSDATTGSLEEVDARQYRKKTMLIVAAIFAGAIVLNVFVSRLDAKQSAFKLAIAEARNVAAEAEGEVRATYYGEPVVCSLHAADSELLQRFLQPMIENQTRVSVLDLRRCRIDDTVLNQVSQLELLATLDLSQTQVNGSGFSQLSDLYLGSISLDGLDLTQADWAALPVNGLHTLSVNNSKLSQKELSEFLKRAQQLTNLGLRGCFLEQELRDIVVNRVGRSASPRLNWLDLQNTNVDDDFVRQLPKNRHYERLELGGTKITNDALTHLAKSRILRLGLARTSVTDEAVAKLLVGWPQTYSTHSNRMSATGVWTQYVLDFGSILDLSETDVDGSCLAGRRHLPRQVNLTGTKVDDSLADHLHANADCDELNLSGTNITDAILLELAKRPSIRKIVIADTDISMKALVKLAATPANIAAGGGQEWAVAPGQFTSDERLSIETAGLSISIEVPKNDAFNQTVP